jgi:hypothetical protein
MRAMNHRLLDRALRRALLASLAAPAVAAIAFGGAACGGNVVVDATGSGTGASTTGSTTGSSGGTGGSTNGCELASTTPIEMFGTCTSTFLLVGSASDCSPGANGSLTAAQCAALCPPNASHMEAMSCGVTQPNPGGGDLTCTYYIPCGTGRRPEGFALAPRAHAGRIAAFLAAAAELEAASVVAFDRLAGELEAYGAPARLVAAARRSAREEVGHARTMQRFARRAGVRPAPAAIASASLRSLEAVAIENAVEGCVRETFGVVVAERQALGARSPSYRRAMKRIAREEASHAAFSWVLARWLEGRLDRAARRRVRSARTNAARALATELSREPDAALIAELGLPTAAEAHAALETLANTLWAAANRAPPRRVRSARIRA